MGVPDEVEMLTVKLRQEWLHYMSAQIEYL